MTGWIDYKQEQPEKVDNYLCALQSIAGTVSYAILAWSPWEGCKGWYGQDNKGNVKPYKGLPVIYWMPLPDVPEENNDEQIT